MQYRIMIHQSGTVNFVADTPGLLDVEVIEGGDPIVEARQIGEAEYKQLRDRNVHDHISFDHSKNELAFKRKKGESGNPSAPSPKGSQGIRNSHFFK